MYNRTESDLSLIDQSRKRGGRLIFQFFNEKREQIYFLRLSITHQPNRSVSFFLFYKEIPLLSKIEQKVRAIRPQHEITTLQNLPYFLGISGQTVGSTGLSMHLVVIPPGARAEPHVHIDYETGIYVLEGKVLTRWGASLENEVISTSGEFLFIPAGIPHDATNLSKSEPARAVVARNDPAEQDKVMPYKVTSSK